MTTTNCPRPIGFSPSSAAMAEGNRPGLGVAEGWADAPKQGPRVVLTTDG